jgi:hypothetical protein
VPLILLFILEPSRAKPAAKPSGTTSETTPIAVLAIIYGLTTLSQIAFYLIPVQLPFFLDDPRGYHATQTNFEAFYNIPVSKKFHLTPIVQVISNAGNQRSNETIVTGTLRGVFSF